MEQQDVAIVGAGMGGLTADIPFHSPFQACDALIEALLAGIFYRNVQEKRAR